MESDWLTAVRMILSGVILLALVLPREKQRLFGVMKNRTDLLWLLAFAILGLLYCQYSFLAAIAHSNSGTATILQSLNVVMMAAVMAVWNRTGIGLRQTAAIVLAILGTYLVATHGNPAEMMVSPAGLAWGLSAAVGVVFYTLLSRPDYRMGNADWRNRSWNFRWCVGDSGKYRSVWRIHHCNYRSDWHSSWFFFVFTGNPVYWTGKGYSDRMSGTGYCYGIVCGLSGNAVRRDGDDRIWGNSGNCLFIYGQTGNWKGRKKAGKWKRKPISLLI